MEALPRRDADATGRRDLLSLLQPADPIRRGMFKRLRGVSVTTRPYSTNYKGMCGRDELTLWYAAKEARKDPADAPLTPYSVTGRSSFRLIDLAQTRLATGGAGDAAVGAKCQHLADDDREWFSAPTANFAAAAVQALSGALEAIRRGTITPACADFSGCAAKIVAGDRVRSIDSVEECDATANRECFRLSFSDNVDLRIIATASDQGDVPQSIESIAYSEFIVVT